MDHQLDLADKLDFSHGISFQREVLHRFNRSVHHPSSSPIGSFFLLVTFRRFTFRLTEESVALVLQSCLGGSSYGFHVTFVSENHFRISVSCKLVGFHIYALRCFIGSCFDIYFHLWNDGVAYRESDKRRWEIEQDLEWTTVLSRKQRKNSRGASVKWIKKKKVKKVRFAEKIVQDSPIKKFIPEPPGVRLTFGAFHTTVLPDQAMHQFTFARLSLDNHVDPRPSVVQPPVKSVFRRILSDLSVDQPDANFQACSSLRAGFSPGFQNSKVELHCSRCLGSGHWASSCTLGIKCLECGLFGHIAKFCLSRQQPNKRIRPNWRWIPKPSTHLSKDPPFLATDPFTLR